MAALTVAAFFIPPKANAVSAEKAILLDADSGRILYSKNADSRSLIASTTKIMTALVVCQHCNVLDRVKIPKEAVGIEGSSMYLAEGEILTVQELLYGLMLRSGNDAAVALAIYCGGTVEGFAEMMNDKARALCLRNTHFSNPHGLDAPDHYSSAADLAKLSAYAMKDPIFSMTVSTKSVKFGDRFLQNHNKLLWRYPDANGIKTGYTKAAGRILVSSAMRNGRTLICVTINAPDDWNDHIKLLNSGFSDFSPRTIVKKGQRIGSVSVAGGTQPDVWLVADESFDYALSEGESVSLEIPGIGYVYAPVSFGAFAGNAHIYVNGNAVGCVPLSYGDSVEMIKSPAVPWYRRFFKVLN